MPNRYTRDQIIYHGLKMAMLPNLEVHDMPDGVVLPHAHSLTWLQDILDFWYHMRPFSATVVSTPLNCTPHVGQITLPANFMLDVRNGYLVRRTPDDPVSLARTTRVPLQKFLNRKLHYQRSTVAVTHPHFYCVQGANEEGRQFMKLAPIPTIATVGELWYYQLPPILRAHDKPLFPNDYVCVEYIRIRAHEWGGVANLGTAQLFCQKIVDHMKVNGLLNEPEDDEIPFDTMVHGRSKGYANTYTWMGPV